MKTDDQLLREFDELSYRDVECKLSPEHPASRANAQRWKRELDLVTREGVRRGLLTRPLDIRLPVC